MSGTRGDTGANDGSPAAVDPPRYWKDVIQTLNQQSQPALAEAIAGTATLNRVCVHGEAASVAALLPAFK